MNDKNQDTKKTKRRSITRRFTSTSGLILLVVLLVVSAIMAIQLQRMSGDVSALTQTQSDTAQSLSTESMTQKTKKWLVNTAESNAYKADDIFKEFGDSVKTLASLATKIESDPSSYKDVNVSIPDASKDGELSVQLIFAPDTDSTSQKVLNEAAKLGNVSDYLMTSHSIMPGISSNYVATESGIDIVCDYISGTKFDEDKNVITIDITSRPWYVGAKKAKGLYFTPVVQDINTDKYGMMCGFPIYDDDKNIVGVAGAGMYLDSVRDVVNSLDIGDNGFSCIINSEGQILFSSAKEGSFAQAGDTEEAQDLREGDNAELAELVKGALNGKNDIVTLNIDDTDYLIAYTPMTTVGWTYMTILPEEEALADTYQLVDKMAQASDEAKSNIGSLMKQTTVIMLIIIIIVLLVSIVVSMWVARKISGPIVRLKNDAAVISEGNLDYRVAVTGNDEVTDLASQFNSMTNSLKDYIENLNKVTAEKERIGAELNVATQIQADMLPRIFPPYPERDEFDLYATMNPAKEVGGDFYDFFLVDDNHIAMVMADVSGKGVPAALFMVIAKTLIKNRAQMGGGPTEIMNYVNDQLCEGNDAELFVTVWLGIVEISTGKGLAINAGHEHPVIKRAGGDFELVEYRHSPAVAVMEGMNFKQHEFEMHPGDVLYVYTDGVAEATNASDELYGTERLLNVLNDNKDASMKELLEAVRTDVDEFVDEAPQFDDITMLGFVYKGN